MARFRDVDYSPRLGRGHRQLEDGSPCPGCVGKERDGDHGKPRTGGNSRRVAPHAEADEG